MLNGRFSARSVGGVKLLDAAALCVRYIRVSKHLQHRLVETDFIIRPITRARLCMPIIIPGRIKTTI